MMIFKVVLFSFLTLLCACSSLPERIPLSNELIGEFWMGDGLGLCEGIALKDDNTYKVTYCGGEHIGLGSSYEKGRWQIDGNLLTFSSESAAEPKMQAEIFYYKDSPAFVKTTDLKRGKVSPWHVFNKSLENK